jgi:hypothetical protein
LPSPSVTVRTLVERATVFLKEAGTVILACTIALPLHRALFATAGLVFLSAGCSHQTREAPSPGDAATGDSITLERTVCFGKCPTYRVSIDANGRVRFVSLDPRDSTVATAEIDPRSVHDLFATAQQFRLEQIPEDFTGKAPYCSPVATDFPSAIIDYFEGSAHWHVRDYHGCFERNDQSGRDVIKRLRIFELAIDSVAGTARWIAKPPL